MFKKLLQITLAGFFSGSTFLANAETLVDTGVPTPVNGALALDSTQWVSAGISLAGPNNITDINGYFWIRNAGGLTLALYSENEDTGLPGSQLFSQEFSIAGDLGTRGWFGISGVNWSVSSGNYWISYEVREGQTFDGAVEFASPSPVKMAVKNDYYTNWVLHGGGPGLIVEGTPVTAVPEPHTFAMLLAGLGFLGVAVRLRKQALT